MFKLSNYVIIVLVIFFLFGSISMCHAHERVCDWRLTVGMYGSYDNVSRDPYGDVKVACHLTNSNIVLVPMHHRSSIPETDDNTKNNSTNFYGIEVEIKF